MTRFVLILSAVTLTNALLIWPKSPAMALAGVMLAVALMIDRSTR